MDMTHICRNCSTDEREGLHRQAALSPDGNSVTFSCTFPRHSDLPRAVAFVSFGDTTPEYWYRKEVADEARRVNEGRITAPSS